MKKWLILGLVFLMVFQTSCTREEPYTWVDSDSANADAQMDLLLEGIKTQNAEMILSLFAPNAVAEMPDIEKDIDALLLYCNGRMGQYNNWGGPYSESSVEYGERKTAVFGTYDVGSENATYRFAFQYVSRDTAEPENVGLWSICVKLEEDEKELEFAYWGSSLYTTGIHIDD